MQDEDQLPTTINWSLQHYQQRSNWDCGLSCVLMCLDDEIRKDILKDVPALCREEGFGQSTWTIDLCYIIRHKNPQMNILYTTITLGVDPGYASQTFYDTILKKDTDRVSLRFEKAAECKIKVEKRSVVLPHDIINHLAHKGVCIVLTNAKLLRCQTCDKNSSALCIRSRRRIVQSNFCKCLSWLKTSSSSYQGHYVLVCGYMLKERQIVYRNPSVGDRECVMSFDAFENARTSYGTDEDVIFIDMDMKRRTVSGDTV